MAKRTRRTKVQMERDREILFDAIKTGVVEGHYGSTRCKTCGEVKPCAGRTRGSMRCREHIR